MLVVASRPLRGWWPVGVVGGQWAWAVASGCGWWPVGVGGGKWALLSLSLLLLSAVVVVVVVVLLLLLLRLLLLLLILPCTYGCSRNKVGLWSKS